jgi:hypothetical protein
MLELVVLPGGLRAKPSSPPKLTDIRCTQKLSHYADQVVIQEKPDHRHVVKKCAKGIGAPTMKVFFDMGNHEKGPLWWEARYSLADDLEKFNRMKDALHETRRWARNVVVTPERLEGRDYPWRRVEATCDSKRHSKCPYCMVRLRRGEPLIGHYGIRYGHPDCVESAYASKTLILSNVNNHRRRNDLAARACQDSVTPDERTLERRVFEKGKDKWPGLFKVDREALNEHQRKTLEGIKTMDYAELELRVLAIHEAECTGGENCPICAAIQQLKKMKAPGPFPVDMELHKSWDDVKEYSKKDAELTVELMKKAEEMEIVPPPSCPHFPAQLIEVIVMPGEMQPNLKVINADTDGRMALLGPERLLEEDPFKDILERVWKKLIEERFSHYKKAQRVLPSCSTHQWMRATVDKPAVCLELEVTRISWWKRAIWWVCPAEQ